MKDALILGGHPFDSRFILGSGKFSLDLVRAVAQEGGAQIITLALRRANDGGAENILEYTPDGITLPAPQRRRCVSPGWPGPSAAAIL